PLTLSSNSLHKTHDDAPTSKSRMMSKIRIRITIRIRIKNCFTNGSRPRKHFGRSNGGVWRPSPNEVFSRPGPICETVLDPDPDRNPDPDLAHHPALARRCIVMSLVQRVRGESKRRRIT